MMKELKNNMKLIGVENDSFLFGENITMLERKDEFSCLVKGLCDVFSTNHPSDRICNVVSSNSRDACGVYNGNSPSVNCGVVNNVNNHPNQSAILDFVRRLLYQRR